MTEISYPSYPAGLDPGKLTTSTAFRKQVRKVIGAILLFVIVYLLLVLAAIALAVACGWLGIFLILHLSNFAILLIGLGIIGVGISVIYFLIKFIFAVARDENSRRTEITETEQPRLFAFIRELARETQTPFPKKVYLSPDVNACVFYNSSFWSMFLPVRKNLEIGLGLVNSINVSEFKAVVAHEFGHFSQKSMKLGSFTYNVNRIIYNMLFENKDYTAFLQSWGNLHTYLRIFAGITVKIANSIQWLLRGMYKVINRSYLGLSREMEFHADAVAASVSKQELDKSAFLFFLRQPNTDTDRLKANYRRFRALSIRNEEFVTIVNSLLKRLNPFSPRYPDHRPPHRPVPSLNTSTISDRPL